MTGAAPEFHVLGPFEVLVEGRDLTPSRPKQRALLALLLLRANEVVASDELVEALWGERPPETAPTALHGHVSALRKLYGSEVIETHPPGYLLRVTQEQSDVGRFQSLVDKARRESEPARRDELLRTALELFRGEPLAEFRYDSFARDEIVRLEEARLAAEEERMQAELDLGRHASIVTDLERLAASHPHRERLRAQLMLALYRSGRQTDALHAYQDGRRLLSEELGLDPGPSLQELERQILTHDPALAPPVSKPADSARAGRERKLVTVLFCDLVGFTARAEELDPEDVQDVLEPYFARVRGEMERFGGTVEKFIGDAVMAVFGAPVAHEDDPERAVRAALAIRDALAGELELRIAVHTGEALVTLDADPRTGQGIVAGDVVNTASRLQHAAAPGSVIVGEVTHRATERAIEYRELEPVVARGKREPVRVSEAVAAGARGERREEGTPFVGRGSDLSQLHDALVRARERREPQLVTILGVPGIGKTRLLRELYRRVESDPEPALWLVGRSLPYGEGVTFWALGEIVKTQAGIYEGDPAAEVEQKLRLTVTEAVGDGGEAEWVLRNLRPLVGLGAESELTGASRGEAVAAWCRFLEGVAEDVPVALVFEDLHWADDGLLDFVDELTEATGDVPLLVLCTMRPELLERRPAWAGGKRNATTISLAPLSADDTASLLAALLDQPSLDAALEDALVGRTEGNPLYAEEYARLLRELGAGADLPTPSSLHSLIAARLDGLPPLEKALVQDAAVIGESVWAGAIAAVGERPRSALDEPLRSLERKEFMRRRRQSAVENEAEYTFRHALVRDVAYSQIPHRERGRKHLLAGEWIEALAADRSEDRSEMLAHHYLRALEYGPEAAGETELEERAGKALRAAGDRAFRLNAVSVAVRFYSHAVELWPAGDPARARLLLVLGHALYRAGEASEAALEDARDALLEAGDREGAGEAEALLAERWWDRGQRDRCFAHLDRAAELVGEGSPSPAKAHVLSQVSRYRMLAGETEEAIRVGRRVLAMAEALGLDELRAKTLNTIGTARRYAGDVAGREDIERSIEIAVSAGSSEAARAYNNLASATHMGGDARRAGELWAEGARAAERFGNAPALRYIRGPQMRDAFFAGRWDESLRLAAEFIAECADSPHYGEILVRTTRGNLRLARGDSEGALEDAQLALALARQAKDPQVLLPALASLAFVQIELGLVDESESLFDELVPGFHVAGLPAPRASVELALVAGPLGRGDEVRQVLEARRGETPWFAAAWAVARGDLQRAADILGEIGSLPDEAYIRLHAAERLLSAGHPTEAEEQLENALAFYRSVAATRYLEEAAALRAASA